MAFNVNQVYEVVNNIAKVAWGENAIQAVDLTGIIAMGDKIISSSTDTDAFMNALVNRIGRTIISNRKYDGAIKAIRREIFEYGSIMQKIYISPFEAAENKSWSKINAGDAIDLGVISPPDAKQYLFEVKDVYQFNVTLPDYQINTAFTSAENVGAFISAIYVAMDTSIEYAVENLTNAAICNFIAEKIHYQKQEDAVGVHAIDVLALYNEAFELNLTPEQAIINADFLKFHGRLLKTYIDRMTRISTLYNTSQLKRHTPKDKMQIFILSDYASANETYLESDTFHDELVKLPGYTPVPYWLGSGTGASFEEVSTVNVTTSAGNAVEQKYVTAVIMDYEAVGIMFNRRETKSFYAANQEVTQLYEKMDYGYFNDLSENGIVFYLGEAA